MTRERIAPARELAEIEQRVRAAEVKRTLGRAVDAECTIWFCNEDDVAESKHGNVNASLECVPVAANGN